MKKITLFILMVIVMGFNSLTKANELKQTIESNSALPSVQTQDELELLAPPGKIQTRQDPDEDGWAQKETPISSTTMSVILLMTSSCIGYAYLKKRTYKTTEHEN